MKNRNPENNDSDIKNFMDKKQVKLKNESLCETQTPVPREFISNPATYSSVHDSASLIIASQYLRPHLTMNPISGNSLY